MRNALFMASTVVKIRGISVKLQPNCSSKTCRKQRQKSEVVLELSWTHIKAVKYTNSLVLNLSVRWRKGAKMTPGWLYSRERNPVRL
jgi:hypothetical protein